MLYSTPYDNIRMPLYMVFPWLRKIVPQQFTTPSFTTFFKDLLDQAMEMRKANNISRDDYLNFLIDLQKRKNTPMHLIYAHAYTFFLDGFETTSYILGNAVNFLAKHQECQGKLRAEIQNHRHVSFDELHQMKYLDAVFNGRNWPKLQ